MKTTKLGMMVVVAAAITGLPACFTATKPQSQTTTVRVMPAADSPVVEAFMEFVGPPERWAGPQTLMVHLTAKDPEFAMLTVNPPVAEPGALVAPLANRSLAGPRRPVLDGSTQISYGLARESLASLNASIKDTVDSDFSGCLYPLRLKLVHANGAITERNGCRSVEGWPVVLSQVTHAVLTASVRPDRTLPVNRALASH